MSDYQRFKTPFYEIEIGDADWKRRVKLPHHIARLVEKVEIVENMMVADAQTPSSITIHFVEGSREPASPDYNLGTSGLYQVPSEGDNIDMSIAGSLTNRSGLITDLRFSGNQGITFLTDYEKRTGRIDNRVQENVEGNNTTRDYKYESVVPTFLFQERNKLKVTWGYKEDPATVRSIMMSIQVVTTDFPQDGMPKTTVQGLSWMSIADQIATKGGVPFAIRKITSKANDSLIEFIDQKTDVIIKKIADDSGMKAIVSTNLPYEVSDIGKQKMWLAGESFQQFMKKMADLSGCYYEILPNPDTGQQTIFFIKYADFEKRVILTDKELLNWKGSGSILKSVNVTADFGGMHGNTQAGVDKEDVATTDVAVSDKLITKYTNADGKKEQAMATDPKGINPDPNAIAMSEKVAKNGTTGVVEASPNTTPKNKEDKAAVGAVKNAKMIALNFDTIGYTRLVPGVMEITGIGVRYSGKYRIMSVTHSLDSNGYHCKCQGTSEMLAAGGVTLPKGIAEGEDKKETVSVIPTRTTGKPTLTNVTAPPSVTSELDNYLDFKFSQGGKGPLLP